MKLLFIKDKNPLLSLAIIAGLLYSALLAGQVTYQFISFVFLLSAIPIYKKLFPVSYTKSIKSSRREILYVLLLLVFFTFYNAQKIYDLESNGIATDGLVIGRSYDNESDIINRPSRHDSRRFLPIISFDISPTKTIQFTDKNRVFSYGLHKGDSAPVIYLPENPSQTAIVNHGIGNWINTALWTLLLLFIAGIGLSNSKLKKSAPKHSHSSAN